MNKLELKLNEVIEEAKQAAREIYYAQKHIKAIRDIEPSQIEYVDYAHEVEKRLDWVNANLELALNYIGVRSPEEVGLSSIALGRR